jgi:hypothetical protein
MPLPSRKELTAQLQSALGALLEKYAIEGKKTRKLTEKAAGKLAKALKKNAGKQELKKGATAVETGEVPKKVKKPKKNGLGKDGMEQNTGPDATRAMPVEPDERAGKKENNKKPDLVSAL